VKLRGLTDIKYQLIFYQTLLNLSLVALGQHTVLISNELISELIAITFVHDKEANGE